MNMTYRGRLLGVLAAAFILGFAAGHAYQIGSVVLTWVALLSGIGISLPALWQSIIAERALQLQRRQHASDEENREAVRRRAQVDLEAMAQQVYQRVARPLLTMPDTPIDTWYDWGAMFGVVAGQELRRMFLELQQAASEAGETSAAIGRQIHADFLELERTVYLIAAPNNDPRSPADLVQHALGLRTVLRHRLMELGAQVDWSASF
jgi:hypothetical protein